MNQEEIDRLRKQRQNGNQPRAVVSDDGDVPMEQRQRFQQQEHHQPPSSPPRRQPPPDPRQQRRQPMSRQGFVSREQIMQKYPLAFSAFGVLCEINSFYTNMYFVWWLWDIMFHPSWIMYIVGLVASITLFLGQIFNSDYEIYDNDGEQIGVNKGMKWGYYAFLTPDAVSSMVFWLIPFMRVMVFIFMHTRFIADDARDLSTFWVAAWNTDKRTFIAYTFCLLLATSVASAWGTLSAYYPEKALLGPRMREQIRAALGNKAGQLMGVLHGE